MGKPNTPSSPNYGEQAIAQGAANKDAALQTAQASNPNITNPYGTQRVGWTYDPGTQGWSPNVTQSLSPVGQQRFDQEQRINLGLGDLGEQGLGYVQNTLDSPFDTSALPKRSVDAGQTAQDAILSRVEPQIKQDREALRTQLYNQGISEGSTEAWDNAQRPQMQRENDMRMQAALQGIQVGDTARNQAIQEQSFLRNEPLNTLNAVRSGAPVGIPQFQGWQGSQVAASPVFNAAQAQGMFDVNKYGIQAGGSNNMMQGLFGIGQAFAGRG